MRRHSVRERVELIQFLDPTRHATTKHERTLECLECSKTRNTSTRIGFGILRDPKSDTPPFDEHGCGGEMACVRAVCVMHVARSAITVRVRPGSGVQRSASCVCDACGV